MAGDRLDVSFNPSDDEIWVENRDFFHTYKYLALKYVGVAHWNVPKVSDMRMIQFHKLPNSVSCSMTGSVVLTGQQHVTDRQTDGPDRYRSATVTRGKSQIPLRYPGRRQVRSWSQSRPNSSSLQVGDQLRTCLRQG